MKTLLNTLLITILLASSNLFAQFGGNMLYEQSNRYIQNKNYNEGHAQFDITSGDSYYWNDDQQSYQANNEMTFEVSALKNVTADSYMAIFNLIQLGQTASMADELLNERYNGLRNDLKNIGVTNENIYIDMISLIPIYEIEVEKKVFSKTYNEVPKGFEMQKNIHIYFEKASTLDKIITLAAKYEIYDLIKVEYYVNDNAGVYEELRNECIKSINKKLDSFKELNIDLDTVFHIISEKSAVAYPVDRYKTYQTYSGSSIEAIKKGSSVSAVRKPKTMFYNKLTYHNFDIIINPVVIEPAVQFTYKLKIKYEIKKEASKKQYYIVSPDGTIRDLPLE